MLETTTTTPELNVPIIDLAKVYDDSTSEDEIVKMIGNACSEFGFFHVVNHGISVQTIQQYSDQCRRYFALPREVKQQWKRGDGNSRGYFDDELTKQKRDWKEALDFGVPGQRTWSVPDDCDDPPNKCLDGFNQFPTEEELPGFRTVVTTYFDACAELSDRIAILMAKGLGVGPDAANSPMIRELREKHSSYLRSNHYPPCDDTENNLGISPHRDAGFLTVLLQDQETHSLQVWKDGHWITVHPEPGAFTINTGDMAQIYSNGRYKAPLHRVLANESHERYSAPFFYNPSYETRVRPTLPKRMVDGDSGSTGVIETSTSTDHDEALYHDCLWGYFRAVRFAGDLTDLGVEIQVDDFLKDAPISTHIEKQEIFFQQADFTVPFSVQKHRPLLQQ